METNVNFAEKMFFKKKTSHGAGFESDFSSFLQIFSELLWHITCNTFGFLSSEDACKHKQYLHVHEL